VKESRLQDHLHRLKDIFLLGRGDLFQALIEAADVLLCCPPSPMTTHGECITTHCVSVLIHTVSVLLRIV